MVSEGLFEEPPLFDPALDAVATWFTNQPDMVGRFGRAIRQSFDEVFDGQRTGRYCLDQLAKTEKTYIGTKVELVIQQEFGLQQGKRMDYLIEGHEVDAKWSMKLRGWMIPTEAIGQVCLCVTADDDKSTFSVGLIRIHVAVLTAGKNKDSKGQISPDGLKRMHWLARDAPLPVNLLLHIGEETRNVILNPNLSGQARVNELFARVQDRIIRREVVLAVAKQDDGPKRVRDARGHLEPLDIMILGHQGDHPRIAAGLGLPVPQKGEWLSVALYEAEPGSDGAVEIDGQWRRRSEDPGP